MTVVYIETDVEEISCENVDCIHLAELAACREDCNRPLGWINDGEFLGELSGC